MDAQELHSVQVSCSTIEYTKLPKGIALRRCSPHNSDKFANLRQLLVNWDDIRCKGKGIPQSHILKLHTNLEWMLDRCKPRQIENEEFN